LLTGKYRRNEAAPAGARLTMLKRLADRYMTDGNWDIVEGLRGFAAERGHSLLELAMSWLARRAPVASVIAGATSPAQLEETARAAGWRRTAEEMAGIDRITKGG
jgi:aryl-alcohol dehydrogenase-like predicted oxidoreductase